VKILRGNQIVSETPEQYYTVAEVATMLRVSRMTVYRMIEADEITHVTVGRCFRIPHAAYREYIQTNIRKAVLR
jgi:excisionase family DNA binding protein